MRRSLAVIFVVLCAPLMVPVAQQASAGVRHPIGMKGLWWGEVQGVALDARGDVYVAGTEHEHMVVQRHARGGGLVWQRMFSVPGRDRYVDARGGVAVGLGGSVYVAGLVGLRTGDTEFPDVGAFVRAYGPGGVLRWQRVVHLKNWQSEIATGVAAGPGFVVMTGYSTCFECVSHEGWVRAWNENGRPLWTDDFEFAGIADEKRDKPNAVAVDRDGSVYVVGVVDRLEDEYGGEGPPADSEVVVRRMSSTGRIVWTRVLSDRSRDSDWATSVAVRDGRVVVGALFGASSGTVAPHPWVRAYTTSGEALWTRIWPSGVGWYDEPAVALGRWHHAFVALPTSNGVRVQGVAAAGWLRWTSRVEGRSAVGLAAGESLLRLTAQRPQSDRALLITYRA